MPLSALIKRLTLATALGFGIVALRSAPTAAEVTTPDIAVVRPPPVALIISHPKSESSALHHVRAGEPIGRALARFEHQPASAIRARVRPGDSAVFVTASIARRGDFDAALFRLVPGRPSQPPSQPLCDQLVHASAPLIAPDGRIFVSRGVAGASRAAALEYRIDDLSVDRVDPSSGAIDNLYRHRGYLMHLAGFYPRGGTSGEVIVYRIGPQGAALIAVDAVSGRIRMLRAPLIPFARDFSIDHHSHRLIYRQRDRSQRQRWTVESIDLRNGAHRTHASDNNFALAPAAWPGGGILLNPHRRGPRLIETSQTLAPPWRRGVDVLRAVDRSGRFVALSHTEQGRRPVGYVYDRLAGVAQRLPEVPASRITIAGFVTGSVAAAEKTP
jgi:hypothetical protein